MRLLSSSEFDAPADVHHLEEGHGQHGGRGRLVIFHHTTQADRQGLRAAAIDKAKRSESGKRGAGLMEESGVRDEGVKAIISSSGHKLWIYEIYCNLL